MKCNATLTTATFEDCPNDSTCYPDRRAPEHVGADRHATFHTVRCTWDADVCMGQFGHGVEGAGPYNTVRWMDSTPGATPHTPSLVTDAEVEAAYEAYPVAPMVLRACLEAAARVRQTRSPRRPGAVSP